MAELKKFTVEELEEYNGNGKPAYVAFNGKVYDVSQSGFGVAVNT